MTGTAGELAAWLREAVLERLELAREACDGDSGQRFTGRKWNVFRAEDEARYDEDYQGEENRLVTYGNVKVQSLHIAANDPQDTIARCEAELGILDLYEATAAIVQSPPVMPEGHPCAGKISARDYMDARRELAVLEPVVRLLGTGYRTRAGYKAEWGP